MNIYAHNILDHYQRPRHRGLLKNADASFHELNRSCGDDMTAYVKIKDGLVSAISFEGLGCAIAIASSSIISDSLLGKEVTTVMSMDLSDLQPLLGIDISTRRQKCALIGLRALQGAIKKTQE